MAYPTMTAAGLFSTYMHEQGRHTRVLFDAEESRVAVCNKRSGDPYRDMVHREYLVLFRADGVTVSDGDRDHDIVADAEHAWREAFGDTEAA